MARLFTIRGAFTVAGGKNIQYVKIMDGSKLIASRANYNSLDREIFFPKLGLYRMKTMFDFPQLNNCSTGFRNFEVVERVFEKLLRQAET